MDIYLPKEELLLNGGTPQSASGINIEPVLFMGASGVNDTVRSHFANGTGGQATYDLQQNDNLDIHMMSNKSNSTHINGLTTFDFREKWVEAIDRSGTYTGHKAIMLGIAPNVSNESLNSGTYYSYGVNSAEIRVAVWRNIEPIDVYTPDGR